MGGFNIKANIPWWKRVFDIVFSLVAILLTLPLMVLIALIIKLTDRESVFFYTQKMLGLNGKKFRLIRFRTMYEGNEKILQEYLKKSPKAREEWGKYRELKSYDPRIITTGRFIRKTSLDELPQFFNVLKGDMSVVGQRPYIKKEFKDYNVDEEIINKLLSVKPGITGLWQIKKRNEATFKERIKQDLEYIENQSFWLDLKIILKTIKVILIGRGAY